MTNDLPYTVELVPEARRARELTAAALRAAGGALHDLALRLSHRERAGAADAPVLEFYAEAGAPEGALYVNGQLVGHVGVTRL